MLAAHRSLLAVARTLQQADASASGGGSAAHRDQAVLRAVFLAAAHVGALADTLAATWSPGHDSA